MRKRKVTTLSIGQMLSASRKGRGGTVHGDANPVARRRRSNVAAQTKNRPPLPSDLFETVCRLLARWPDDREELAQMSPDGVILRLSQALIAERRRARQGHWAYDLRRHVNLCNVLKSVRTRTSGSTRVDRTVRNRCSA